jgi:hypothetical protein
MRREDGVPRRLISDLDAKHEPHGGEVCGKRLDSAWLDPDPRRFAIVLQHQMVLDVAVWREHQTLAHLASGQRVKMLRGQRM